MGKGEDGPSTLALRCEWRNPLLSRIPDSIIFFIRIPDRLLILNALALRGKVEQKEYAPFTLLVGFDHPATECPDDRIARNH